MQVCDFYFKIKTQLVSDRHMYAYYASYYT